MLTIACLRHPGPGLSTLNQLIKQMINSKKWETLPGSKPTLLASNKKLLRLAA